MGLQRWNDCSWPDPARCVAPLCCSAGRPACRLAKRQLKPVGTAGGLARDRPFSSVSYYVARPMAEGQCSRGTFRGTADGAVCAVEVGRKGVYPDLASPIGERFKELLLLICSYAPPIQPRWSVASRWMSVGSPWTAAAPSCVDVANSERLSMGCPQGRRPRRNPRTSPHGVRPLSRHEASDTVTPVESTRGFCALNGPTLREVEQRGFGFSGALQPLRNSDTGAKRRGLAFEQLSPIFLVCPMRSY